jgi:predicted enzyme related to lactoylglutathione lyase
VKELHTVHARHLHVDDGHVELVETRESQRLPSGCGTDDIDSSLAKAESHGGKNVTPKTEIPNTGWFGFFSDPTGNLIGLYTPLESEG